MLFENASPGELLALANIVAIALADNLDADDLNVLGAFVTVVGDILAMLAAQIEIIETNAKNSNDVDVK
jgi:Co/Zn/Cd efflux system component